MQKKIAKNKVDSKDKKAPRKGASRESIFNYDIEVTEEMDKKREEKKLRLQKQREKEQKKIEKEKRKIRKSNYRSSYRRKIYRSKRITTS